MKKIILLKSLAILGVVTLTSVCITETVLLFKKNSDEAKIDISTLTGQMIDREQVGDVTPSADELLNLLKDAGVRPISGGTVFKLPDIDDVRVVDGSIQNNSFQITSVPNSTVYEANKTATIYLNIPAKTQLSSIITSTPDLFLDKYENEEITKAQILKNLQTRYIGLNINHLEVTNVVQYGNDQINTADIVAKNGSELYAGLAAVTYYTSGAAIVTYAKTTLAPGDVNILPTFTFAGATQTATYTCTTVAAPITFTSSTGAFAYATGVNFNGGLYQVKASYTSGGLNFIAYANIFAQPNILIGNLTINKQNINPGNLNSGGYTYTENGTAFTSGITFTCFGNAAVTATKDADGMTFNTTSGVLTWDGATPTWGGPYTITATHSGVTAKATVTVAEYTVEPVFAGADTDVLSTATGFLAVLARGSKVGNATVNFVVALSTTRWAPIYNALYLTASVVAYANCMVNGTVYQMEVTERAGAWKYTLLASGTGNLNWTAVNMPATVSVAAGYVTTVTRHYVKIPALGHLTDSVTVEINASLENSKQIIKLDEVANTYFPIYGYHQNRFKRYGYVNDSSFWYLELDLSYLYHTTILITSNSANYWKPTPMTISTSAPGGYTWYNIKQST